MEIKKTVTLPAIEYGALVECVAAQGETIQRIVNAMYGTTEDGEDARVYTLDQLAADVERRLKHLDETAGKYSWVLGLLTCDILSKFNDNRDDLDKYIASDLAELKRTRDEKIKDDKSCLKGPKCPKVG